jgi:hypothetical protein
MNEKRNSSFMFSRWKNLFVFALVLMLFSITAKAASPLYDYHVRVHQASLALFALAMHEEDKSAQTQEYISAALYDMRAMLPPNETVEWKGATIQVNNAWLHEELNQHDVLNKYDSKRKEILTRLAERLNAIEERLTELDGQKITNQKSSTRFPVNQNQTGQTSGGQTAGPQTTGGQVSGGTITTGPGQAGQNEARQGQPMQGQPVQGSTSQQPSQNTTPSNQGQPQQGAPQQAQSQPNAPATQNSDPKSKEAEKAKMNEILSRDEFSKKPPEKSAMEKLWDKLFKREEPKEEQKPEPQLRARPVTPFALILQYIVIGVLFAGIGFVIWKLAPRFLNRNAKKKKEKREARVILGETLKEDETAANLLSEADKLARAGDVRAAIRKAYIALLCELGDRNLVQLAQHKTNRDYLRDVRSKWTLHVQMEQMTNSFERHWYGFEPTSENDWNNFRTSYQQALKQGATS